MPHPTGSGKDNVVDRRGALRDEYGGLDPTRQAEAWRPLRGLHIRPREQYRCRQDRGTRIGLCVLSPEEGYSTAEEAGVGA